MWNSAAYGLLDVPVEVDPVAEAHVAAFELRWGFAMPAAVREWVVGDWRDWVAGARSHYPPAYDLLELLDWSGPGARHLVVDRDSQNCCAFTVHVDEGDDPPVYLVAPDDTTGGSRRVYAERYTTFTRIMAWDQVLFERGGKYADARPLPPAALPWLVARFEPLPPTFGWAGNQGCDTVRRFEGPAMVMVAVEAGTILYSVVVSDDPGLLAEISTRLRAW